MRLDLLVSLLFLSVSATIVSNFNSLYNVEGLITLLNFSKNALKKIWLIKNKRPPMRYLDINTLGVTVQIKDTS